jgi:hypothetical protein
MVYGMGNDQITSRISWEYFYYGKGLHAVLGSGLPLDLPGLHWEATKVGMKATWSAGLIAGVCILLANNPWRKRAQLPYRKLLWVLPMILGCAVVFAAAGAVLGYLGLLSWMSQDFGFLAEANVFRPARFMCVYGIHLGGYLGAGLGTAWAVGWVVWQRFQ